MNEEAEEILRKRHGQLVDKKFLEGLTQEETAELEQVNGQLDEIDAVYYAPTIAKLKALQEVIKNRVQP